MEKHSPLKNFLLAQERDRLSTSFADRRVRKDPSGPSVKEDDSPVGESSEGPTQSSQAPGFGFMKGLLTIEEGYDVTKPSSEIWVNPPWPDLLNMKVVRR